MSTFARYSFRLLILVYTDNMHKVKDNVFIPSRLVKVRVRHLFASLFCFVVLGLTANAQFLDLTRAKLSDMTHEEWATQVISTPSGKEIISAGVDGRVVFWDAATGKNVREVSLPTIVLTVSLSSDGRTLAAGDASGTVSLIDVESAKVKVTFTADKKIVNTTAWSEDGKFLAAGGADGIVRIWSAADAKTIGEINPAHGNIMSLIFSKSQLVIGLLDAKETKRSAEVWDWQKKTVVRTFDEGAAGLRGMSVSPDGKLLAIADFQKAILLSILPVEGKSFEASLHVLPDSDEGTLVAIWDMTTGKRAALIKAENGARGIAFSPDGKMLACSGPNGVIITDIGGDTFAEIGRIDSQTTVDNVAFSFDSKQLLISREREPLVRSGEGGLGKLFDPFFTSLIMQVREGTNSGVTFNLKDKKAKSMTGGSNIEAWLINSRSTSQDTKTWDAVVASFSGKDDDARKLLQLVIKDHPNYGEAQRLYAMFFEAKDVKRLQGLLETSVKSDSNCVSCLRSLGDVQFKTEQFADAVKSYDRVLRLKPEYGLVAAHQADAFGAIALRFMASENTSTNMQAAMDALEHALALRPGVEQFYTNLGAAYYFRSDFDKDISLLLIAQKLRPDHARIYYNLGHAYRYKGDKQKAIEAYRHYVQIGEEGEEARVEKAKGYIAELSK